MRKFSLVLLSIILILSSNSSFGQKNESAKPLFASDSILSLTLSMDVRTVINNRDTANRVYHKARLSYLLPNGDSVTHKLKVMVRGNNRANPKVCSFPPLKLNFKKNKVDSTLFAGQNKLKLVTHCNGGKVNEEYILQEYYIYKLYQLISPNSFKVRLVRITYVDTAGKFKAAPHYGFLIEDIDDVAKRNNMVEFEGKIMNQEMCERKQLDRLMFFQYLIGNLDWSIPYKHNFKLISEEGRGNPVAVPYDFDYSGIINKPDATPPINMNIESVRIRVFRGLCRVDGGYNEAVNYFQEKKPEIYALYQDSPYLSEKSKKSTIKYIDGFYKILDDPKQLNQKIYRACWANHKHLYQY